MTAYLASQFFAAIAFSLGAYRFDRYKTRGEGRTRLFVPGADLAEARAVAHAAALARDMVNTPANDLGPRQIETIAREIAHAHDASVAHGDVSAIALVAGAVDDRAAAQDDVVLGGLRRRACSHGRDQQEERQGDADPGTRFQIPDSRFQIHGLIT